jgi:hypothetical protein
MPQAAKKKTVNPNPNQGEATMPTTTKKKTTATLVLPPTIPAAQPSPAPLGATAITSSISGHVRGKTELINGLVVLMGALTANYAASDTFELPSGTYTIPEVTEAFNAYIATASNVGTVDLAYHAAVAKEQSLRGSAQAIRSELKAYIAARIGKSAPAMAAYGFVPVKIPIASPKAKIAGSAKAEATRVARGTMGVKQKLAITGNVTGVTITPVTLPGAPAPASAALPATAATSNGVIAAPVVAVPHS